MGRAFLPIRLETTWLLLEAQYVEEILGALPCLRLPHARPAVPGIVTWRARAVPVVDLAAFVPSLTALDRSEGRARTVIVRAGPSTLALPVDSASEVESVTLDGMRPLHASDCEIAAAEVELRGHLMMMVAWDLFVNRLFEERTASVGESS